MRSYKILYADNDPDSLEIISEYLRGLGYRVEEADGPDTARDKLTNSFYDLAIIDLRLTEDQDPEDKSGLELAKSVARSTPKLIFSKYAGIKDALEGLRMDGHDIPPAVDFVDKRAGLQALKDAMEKAIAQYVGTPDSFSIVWTDKGLQSFGQLATILDPDQELAEFAQLTGELEMLLRQIFAQYEQVTVCQLLWRERRRCCLSLYAYHHDLEDQYLITFGQPETVRAELQLFQRTVSPTQAGNALYMAGNKEASHVAVILWSIKGLNLDHSQTMADLLVGGTEKEIQTAANALFSSAQSLWYQQGLGKKRAEALTTKVLWGLLGGVLPDGAQQLLQEKAEGIAGASFARNVFPMRVGRDCLEIDWPDGRTDTLPNPFSLLFDPRSSFPVRAAMTTTTAGLCGLDRVLVDQEADCWLTDYAHIGSSIVYRDFASLELSARFEFTQIPDVFSALDFEEQLLSTASLAENVSTRTVVPAYRNLLELIVSARNDAARIFGDYPVAYYLTLLFSAARSFLEEAPGIHMSRPRLAMQAHRLLFMSKLTAQLQRMREGQQTGNASPAGEGPKLRIDEEQRRVWVRGVEKELSHTEFDLLLFLYKKNGAVCRREEILEKVLKYRTGLDKSAKTLINAHINRLRNQIEPDPQAPVFVLTVRNEGYRLNLPE